MTPREPAAAGSRPRPELDILAVVATGGAIGGLSRWAVGRAVPGSPDSFPWATLLENVLGCLAMGVLLVIVVEVWGPTRYVRPFLAVGVLGGFTTFSAYTVETVRLVDDGQPAAAAGYVGASLVGGLLAMVLAMSATRRLTGRGRPPRVRELA